jgi:hypothetical protein
MLFLNKIFNLKTTVELFILISLIQEIWLTKPEGVQWNKRNPVHVPDGTMVKARWRNGTMVKTRWYERETTMVRWWNNEDTMMKTLCYDGENTTLRWWKYNVSLIKLRWHDNENVILFSPLCQRIIVISQICHCISPESRVSLRIRYVDARQENPLRPYTAK